MLKTSIANIKPIKVLAKSHVEDNTYSIDRENFKAGKRKLLEFFELDQDSERDSNWRSQDSKNNKARIDNNTNTQDSLDALNNINFQGISDFLCNSSIDEFLDDISQMESDSLDSK